MPPKPLSRVVCRILIDELDSSTNPVKPQAMAPDFGELVSAAIRVLKLGENLNAKFLKLVSQHHKLTAALGDLTKRSRPVSHGRDGFSRSPVSPPSAGGSVVRGRHRHLPPPAYLEADLDLTKTREPYERFAQRNALIDSRVSMLAEVDEEGYLVVEVTLPDGDSLPLRVEASRLLYLVDREGLPRCLECLSRCAPPKPQSPTTRNSLMATSPPPPVWGYQNHTSAVRCP